MRSDHFTVHCLASGSSANSLLVTCPDGGILVDAGLGMRALRQYVEERGVAPQALSGICITHEHGDHITGAIPWACRWKTPIVTTRGTLTEMVRNDVGNREPPHRLVERNDETRVGPFSVRTFATSHDAAAPCGFRIEWDGQAVAVATDTGIVTPEWQTACVGCQLLVVEANHDLFRLHAGPYPDLLKRRILATTGHLSNDDARELVLSHTADFGPVAVWFAHLSEVNNTPGIVRGDWKRAWQDAGLRASPAAVDIAGRDTPSLTFRSGMQAVQRALF